MIPGFFDETLRDGEQQAGLHLSAALKRRMAMLIARCGVERIDLMPAAYASERELAASLVAEGLGPVLSAATPVGEKFVEEAAACGLSHIILFYACSDRLIFLRDSLLRDQLPYAAQTLDDEVPEQVIVDARDRMLESTQASIDLAHRLGLEVDFAAEDASRADTAFLATCAKEIGGRSGRFFLCDTVGVLSPDETSTWVSQLRDAAPEVSFGLHFHNDRGLALANTLAGLDAGAVMVSGTFRGIGERAGNVALESVIEAYAERNGAALPAVDYDALAALLALLDEEGLRPAKPGSPAANRHLSGMHVQTLLRDTESYSPGGDQNIEIWFGKLSGSSNVRYLFERILGRSLPEAAYARLSEQLKQRSLEQGRDFSSDEVKDWLEQGGFGVEAS